MEAVEGSEETGIAVLEGWLYAGKLAAMAFSVLLALAALKFDCEHRLAPVNVGIGGLLYQPRMDLLLIGSSHTRQSYDMRQLGRFTGLSASYLCAYDGMDMVTIAQVVEYLESQADRLPRNIVVEAYSAKLADQPDLEDPRYFFDAPPRLKREILSTYFSTHRNSGTLLDIFDLMVNRNNEQILAYPVYAWGERSTSYKGGRDGIVTTGVSAQEFHSFTAGTGGSHLDPNQIAAFHRIAALARRAHIAVYFIESPLPSPVSASPRIQQLKSEFSTLVAAENFHYIDGDRGFPIVDPSMFADDNHLSTKGKEIFTVRIGEQLKAWIGSGASKLNHD